MRSLYLAFCVAVGLSTQAQTPLGRYNWADLAGDESSLPGVITNVDGRSALLVRNTNDTPMHVQLLTITNPPISSSFYSVRGEIKYSGVQGDGFLEMWSVFPPQKPGGPEMKFFSRTLGVSGDMGKISGTAHWRKVSLPFDRTGSASAPSSLELNLILPGPGTVYLGNLELAEFPGGAPAMRATAGAWWSERTGGLIGGSMGAVFGCFAGLIAWLASKGKAREFVLIGSWSLLVLGSLLAIGGVAALAARQPYAVWFPLLIGGVLTAGIISSQLRQFRRMYEDQELRRIMAADAIR